MRTEFNEKLEEFSVFFQNVISSDNLEKLKEAYFSFEGKREEIFHWVFNYDCDEEQKNEYLTELAMYEHDFWIDKKTRNLIAEIPIFDDSVFFDDIEKMFDEYGSYFQRFGCLRPDQIISWDNQNVLFMDEFSNIEIVKRPDILLNI